MKQLNNKVALITGASSGIGRSVAKLFAEEGAKVIVVARRQNELIEVVDEIESAGGVAKAYSGDVCDEDTARNAVGYALENFGGLDIAINNAAILGPSLPIQAITRVEWSKIIDTNLTSAFLGAKYQIPAMIQSGGGSLVFVSSFVGNTIGLPNMSAYSATKAGILGLTKALCIECAEHNIRVNALLPGGTETPMGQQAANTPEALAFVEDLHALKRLAKPLEIARSALYLASDNSSFTTGTALLVDGGVSINKT